MGLMRWYDRRPPGEPSARDRVQHQRIRDLLAGGDLVAFVGFPHVPGILRLFEEDGARTTQGAG